MTQARKTLVDPAHAASYHCVARCVRRAWLCGFDNYARKSFEHRKPWVERRILEIGEIFACGIYAYAVMSNHYHLVVHMSPSASNAWSADDVARRWVKLYPTGNRETDQQKIDTILASETLIALYRRRLTDLSWLMKSISEPPLGQVTPISQQNCIRRSLVKPTAARRPCAACCDDLR